MKWNRLFSNPDRKEFNYQKAKRQAEQLAFNSWILLIIYLVFCLFTFFKWDETIMVSVRPYYWSQPTYKSINLPYGHFVTGTSGTLYLKATSLMDYLMLVSPAGVSLLDLIFIILATRLWARSFRQTNNERPFSEEISLVLYKIARWCSYMGLVKGIYNLFLLRWYLQIRTSRMFISDQNGGFYTYFIISGLLFIVYYFSRQGARLQQEQELTV